LTWAQSHEGALFASWGDYDRKQLICDCAVHGSRVPEWLLTHVNIKKDFARCVGGRPCGMRKALDKANLPLDGTHHKGIDDARNIAKLLAYILDRDATLKISKYPC
jgi:inhibitor of KinA sporulation pathway (predicted exonuclease)